MDKFSAACPSLTSYFLDQKLLLLALLDPYSSFLPTDIREGWRSEEEAYQLSRNYFFALHKKREKIIEAKQLKESSPEDEHITDIIVSVYQNI